MAVKIRLKRVGRRNRPSWRIAVIEKSRARDGRSIEDIGFYDTLGKDEPRQAGVDVERARYWLSVGAKPSEIVHQIFKKKGVYSGATAAAPAAETGASS